MSRPLRNAGERLRDCKVAQIPCSRNLTHLPLKGEWATRRWQTSFLRFGWYAVNDRSALGEKMNAGSIWVGWPVGWSGCGNGLWWCSFLDDHLQSTLQQVFNLNLEDFFATCLLLPNYFSPPLIDTTLGAAAAFQNGHSSQGETQPFSHLTTVQVGQRSGCKTAISINNEKQ